MPTLKPSDVSGLDIHPSHSPKVWRHVSQAFASFVTLTAGVGLGWAATSGVPTSKTLTGSATASPLVFDVSDHARGRRISKIDLAYTVSASGTAATFTLTAVAVASLVNDDFFTLLNAGPDGESLVFFYDVDGGSVTVEDDTHILIDVSADTTAADVAARTRTVINAVVDGKWTMAAPVGAAITGTADSVGVEFNVTHTETVANAGFLITAATGGIDASLDALDVSVQALRMVEDGTAVEYVDLAAASSLIVSSDHDSDSMLDNGADYLVTLSVPSYLADMEEGDGQIIRIVGDLAKTGDSLILKAIRVHFADAE
jgi:hypothetical protein